MKKIVELTILVFLVFGAVFSLSSCSKDDSNKNKVVNGPVEETLVSIENNFIDPGYEGAKTFTVKKIGKLTVTVTEIFGSTIGFRIQNLDKGTVAYDSGIKTALATGDVLVDSGNYSIVVTNPSSSASRTVNIKVIITY
ncbi:MAG: hypothetical protein FWC57_02290 [Endomicrobia bacterium]|nr:hypothetical protein [Endomicrobiia bacterium]